MKHQIILRPARHQQRGAAALIVTILLFIAMALVAIFVNRNLVFEQRASANQYRATQAFEAAEAGAEWALAQLDNPQRIGPDCLPSDDSAASSFRSRYLSHAGAAFAPATWSSGGVASVLQPSCVRSNTGWACSCPQNGHPVLDEPSGVGPFPAFTLQFAAGDKPGSIRVQATGCTRLTGACVPGSASSVDAVARVAVTLGLLPGLRTPPAAALTARGSVDADSAAFGAHNTDPATGLAIHAGASLAASQARLTLPAGAPLASALVGNDTSLADLSPEQLFVSYFGLDKTRWKNQTTVQRVTCSVDCGAVLRAAVAATDGSALLWVDGDLAIDGPVTLGSAEHPVVIVVAGSARLRGAVGLHGLLYATTLRWDDTTTPGAALRGAAISESNYAGNATADFIRDAGVLTALQNHSGSFVRINGGWRDF